jgi:hypothetical protein
LSAGSCADVVIPVGTMMGFSQPQLRNHPEEWLAAICLTWTVRSRTVRIAFTI